VVEVSIDALGQLHRRRRGRFGRVARCLLGCCRGWLWGGWCRRRQVWRGVGVSGGGGGGCRARRRCRVGVGVR
jgi:hypothetical protein